MNRAAEVGHSVDWVTMNALLAGSRHCALLVTLRATLILNIEGICRGEMAGLCPRTQSAGVIITTSSKLLFQLRVPMPGTADESKRGVFSFLILSRML